MRVLGVLYFVESRGRLRFDHLRQRYFYLLLSIWKLSHSAIIATVNIMLTPETNPSKNMSSAPLPMPPSPRGSTRELVRQPLSFFLAITRQYGDVVCYRTAPEVAFLINHPDHIRHILVENNKNYSKATYSNTKFKDVIADGLLVSEGDSWLRQRRLMQPAFHQNRLAQLVPLVISETTRVIEQMDAAAADGRPVDISKLMAGLTLSITTKALFGVDLGDEVNNVGDVINMAADLLEKPNHARFQNALQYVDQVVLGIIEEHRSKNVDTGDLLSKLLQARDEETGQGMDDQQLRNQVITLLLAGYETTANALTWTWYLLAQNPEQTADLRAEAINVLPDGLPSGDDLANLPYTRMVFEESLRLYPPAWVLGRKALGEDEIGGYRVPAGTIIAISPYVVHRHMDYWEAPELFDPLRFSAEGSARRHRFAYLPFGAGPRQCIGNTLALLEAQIIVSMIARRFELTLVPDQDIHPQPLFILRPDRPVLMQVNPL
jgi:cytochrome P450